MTRIRSAFCFPLALLAACETSVANEPLPPAAESDGSEVSARDAKAPGGGREGDARVQPRDAGKPKPSELEPTDEEPIADAGSYEGVRDAGSSDVVRSPEGRDDEPSATSPSRIAGSAGASGCTSYGERTGDQCYGFWCGVSEEVIASELQADGPCSGITPTMLCDGAVQQRLQTCGIRERTNLLNLLDSEDMLRMKIRDCFYEDTALAPVGAACLQCFLDGGECAGRNCLTECLASEGRSAACDQCRFDNGCFQPLPACAGIPSPF